jgi:hypothetical protein
VHLLMVAAMLFGMLGGHSAIRSLCAAGTLLVVSAVVASGSRRRGSVAWDHLADLGAMTLLLVLSLGMVYRGSPMLQDAVGHAHPAAPVDPMLLQLLVVAAWFVVRGLQLAPNTGRLRVGSIASAAVTAAGLALMLALH